MIVEGLLTTKNADEVINVAPMGPIVEGDFASLILRPFKGSTTYKNLTSSRCGVFHVVDRVNLIAEAAIRQLTQLPDVRPASVVDGVVLEDCCRWFELNVVEIDDSNDRTVMKAEIVHTHNLRAHQGFNRARHAVIEAAILATRVHLLPKSEIDSALKFLEPAVEKTGEAEEKMAYQMVTNHIAAHYAESRLRG